MLWVRYIDPKVTGAGLSVSAIWRAENLNLKRVLYESIEKMVKEKALNSAAESSCHHNFFAYLAQHL